MCFRCNRRWNSNKVYKAREHFSKLHKEAINDAIVVTPKKSTNICHPTIINNKDSSGSNLEDTNATIDFQYKNQEDDTATMNMNYQNENVEHESTTMNMASTGFIPSFLKNAKDPDLSYASMSDTSKQFFSHNMLHSNNGIRNIVGKAFQKSNNAMAELEETILHLNITLLVRSLSYSQQLMFLRILNHSQQNKVQKTRLPENINDLRSFYLSYKDSIFPNMPSPTIHVNNDHAYISLVSLIDHFLAYDIKMNYMTCDDDNSVSTYMITCKHALQMRQSVKDELQDSDVKPMILYINLWSDDFEPNV